MTFGGLQIFQYSHRIHHYGIIELTAQKLIQRLNLIMAGEIGLKVDQKVSYNISYRNNPDINAGILSDSFLFSLMNFLTCLKITICHRCVQIRG